MVELSQVDQGINSNEHTIETSGKHPSNAIRDCMKSSQFPTNQTLPKSGVDINQLLEIKTMENLEKGENNSCREDVQSTGSVTFVDIDKACTEEGIRPLGSNGKFCLVSFAFSQEVALY